MEDNPTPIETPLTEPVMENNTSDHSASSIMARFNAGKGQPADEQPDPAPQSDVAQQPDPQPESEELTPEELKEAEDMPGPKTKKAVSKWTELKNAKTQWERFQKEELPKKDQELAELRTRLEELSKHDPEHYQKQLEEREKAISDYEKKLAIYDIRESKAWQDEVSGPAQEIGATLEKISQAYEIDYTHLRNAVVESDPATQRKMLAPLLEGMDQLDILEVRDAMRKADAVNRKAAELEQNAFKAKEELDFIRDQETRKQAEERQQKQSAAVKAVEKQFREKLAQFFEDEDTAKKVFGTELPKEDDYALQAYNAYAGSMLKDLTTQVVTLKKEISDLKAAAEKRRAASPQAGGAAGVSGGVQSQPDAIPPGGSVWERWKNRTAE